MTQATRTRSSGVGFGIAAIIVIAVTLGAMLGKAPKGGNDPANDTTEEIVLVTVFTPAVRNMDPVTVIAHVEDVKVVDERLTHSPGSFGPFRIPKGARVIMQVSQGQDGYLECSIMKSAAVQVDSNFRDTAGSTRCYMNRPQGPDGMPK